MQSNPSDTDALYFSYVDNEVHRHESSEESDLEFPWLSFHNNSGSRAGKLCVRAGFARADWWVHSKEPDGAPCVPDGWASSGGPWSGQWTTRKWCAGGKQKQARRCLSWRPLICRRLRMMSRAGVSGVPTMTTRLTPSVALPKLARAVNETKRNTEKRGKMVTESSGAERNYKNFTIPYAWSRVGVVFGRQGGRPRVCVVSQPLELSLRPRAPAA